MSGGPDIYRTQFAVPRIYDEGCLTAVTAQDLRRLDEVFPRGAAAGLRYPETMVKVVNQ